MAIAFSGSFFDGKSSRPHSVQVEVDGPGKALVVEGEDIGRQRFPLELIKVAPRVGNTPRFVYLEGGASLEVADNDAVDQLVPNLPGGRFHIAQYRMESRLRWILAMLALTIALGWATVEYGIPYLAKEVAFALPREVDEKIGDGALNALDELLFEPTNLDNSRRAGLRDRFDDMVAKSDLDAERVRLVFRASPVMGPNALALPSGMIIMTDELVRLARNDEEVLAVLAHEVGHIHHRHSLRSILQNSSVALLLASLTGDLASLSSIAAAAPTLLVELKYSRGFELEADDYAVDLLTGMEIEPTVLGDILIRLTGEHDGDLSDYFSTHPGSKERMERLSKGM